MCSLAIVVTGEVGELLHTLFKKFSLPPYCHISMKFFLKKRTELLSAKFLTFLQVYIWSCSGNGLLDLGNRSKQATPVESKPCKASVSSRSVSWWFVCSALYPSFLMLMKSSAALMFPLK